MTFSNAGPTQSLDSAHWISLLYCSALWRAKPSRITGKDFSGQCVNSHFAGELGLAMASSSFVLFLLLWTSAPCFIQTRGPSSCKYKCSHFVIYKNVTVAIKLSCKPHIQLHQSHITYMPGYISPHKNLLITLNPLPPSHIRL